MKKIKTIILFLVAQLVFVGFVSAGEIKPFNQEEFDKARSDGEVVLLDFYATWCPTCRKQQPVIAEALSQEQFSSVVAFKVDYDSASDLKQEFKIQRQSTLVLLKGKEEKGRLVASTDKDEIVDLLKKGL